MKFSIPTAVSSKFGRTILLTQKHSPSILFAGGVVGSVTSTVLACRATLRVDSVLSEAQHNIEKAKTVRASNHPEYSERDYQKDMLLIYVQSAVKFTKLYGPAIVVGGLSIAALTGSHKILSSRNASLAAAYKAVEEGFAKYRSRVVEEFGEEKDRELRYGSEERTIVEETDSGPKKTKIKTAGPNGASVYARFFDELSPSWSPTWEYNRLFLSCQQTYANDLLRSRGHVFLNEVYDMLGIPRSSAGAVVGWVMGNGDNYVDFGIFDSDDYKKRDFVNGREGGILLDFNVDGVVYDKI